MCTGKIRPWPGHHRRVNDEPKTANRETLTDVKVGAQGRSARHPAICEGAQGILQFVKEPKASCNLKRGVEKQGMLTQTGAEVCRLQKKFFFGISSDQVFLIKTMQRHLLGFLRRVSQLTPYILHAK